MSSRKFILKTEKAAIRGFFATSKFNIPEYLRNENIFDFNHPILEQFKKNIALSLPRLGKVNRVNLFEDLS